MLPVISLGPVILPTYPFFVLIGFWLGLWVAARQATTTDFDSDHVYNAGLVGLIAGIVGARLWFVLSHWDNYAPNLAQALSLSRSALSPTGGLIVAAVVVLAYLQRNRINLGRFFDVLAPGLVVMILLGHTGAFLGGEALGAPFSGPWAVDIAGTPRHPVQAYFAVASLIILAVVLWWSPQLWPGFKFWLFILLYGFSHLLLEIFRANPPMIGGYLQGQITALIVILITLGIMAHKFSKISTTGSGLR